jgi:hypothetical protein
MLTNDIQVGCQGLFDFSDENQRLIFLSSFEKIMVIPMLHRNTARYMGMKDRKNYLATKVMNGRFIALSKKGKIYIWDQITGLLMREEMIELPKYKEFTNFELYTWTDPDLGITDTVYKKEWYSKILIRSKDPLELT